MESLESKGDINIRKLRIPLVGFLFLTNIFDNQRYRWLIYFSQKWLIINFSHNSNALASEKKLASRLGNQRDVFSSEVSERSRITFNVQMGTSHQPIHSELVIQTNKQTNKQIKYKWG